MAILVVSVLVLLISRTAEAFGPSPRVVTNSGMLSLRTTSNQLQRRAFVLNAQKKEQSSYKVCECIGKGSYGTVHILESLDDGKRVVGKRPWNQDDPIYSGQDDWMERVKRCQYYWQVEQHCFEQKLSSTSVVPKYIGTSKDNQDEWMLFELLTSSSDQPAKSLAEVISEEWIDQHQEGHANNHHLYLIQQQLGITLEEKGGDGFAVTLDTIITSILKIMTEIHSRKIVHRDIKPANLLLLPNGNHGQNMILIDFGSAADMEPITANFGFSKRYVGLEDPTRVAVSPNYVAPEMYIQPTDKDDAFKFDVYSGALIICQLVLNYLDEATDAGFNQQFSLEAKNDLDVWLSRCELSSKVRPDGLEDALQYLGSRPGLWNLLKQMLQASPRKRISSHQALNRWNTILSYSQAEDTSRKMKYDEPWMDDGKFFKAVIQNFEQCEIPLEEESADGMQLPRALHYVATFERKMSLGLILSEVADDYDDEDEMDEVSLQKWQEATKNAQPGEVYVRRIVPMGQADLMGKGIIEVGDQVQGVGDFPLLRGGFSGVLELLEDQPAKEKFVRLHFDRSSSLQKQQQALILEEGTKQKSRRRRRAIQQGTWSVLGKRKAQEDAVVLHEIHDGENHNVVLAGVFDGHGGKAASQTASQLMPSLLTAEISSSSSLKEAAQKAWETTCVSYRSGCDELGEQCVADYDPREGILLASTGSKDMIAGTTASMTIFDEEELIVLNCGDSRTLLVGNTPNSDSDNNSALLFSTRDHSPFCELEQKRLQRGRDELGLDYSIPECSMSRWSMKVGDYRYALSRSLEGNFATSKGIVSDPDIDDLSSFNPSMVVTASDGLFEVMDNEEVAQDLLKMRYERNMSASDAAKKICEMALNKGTSDNVSVVVVYLEDP